MTSLPAPWVQMTATSFCCPRCGATEPLCLARHWCRAGRSGGWLQGAASRLPSARSSATDRRTIARLMVGHW